MTILESIRNFIKKCPYLEEYNGAIKLGIDYLGAEVTTYSIEEVPVEPIIKKYVDGSTLRRYAFIFCSREVYGEDVRQNINNSGFYEDFSKWLEKSSIEGNLLIMDKNKEARKIRAITTGYAYNTEINKAQYQIQCELIYYEGVV